MILVLATTAVSAAPPAAAIDPAGEARVVVAVIDTGINPYHRDFRRAGLDLPLEDFRDATTGRVAREVALTFGPDYDANRAADEAAWEGVRRHELVHFPGTNVLAMSFYNTSLLNSDDSDPPVIDDHGHGTATASTVLRAEPGVIIVALEVSATHMAEDIEDAYRWAVAQPWIDVVSMSMGMQANLPMIGVTALPALQRAGWESGKVLVESAGNDPSPLVTDAFDGSPWVLSITGSHAGGEAREVSSSTFYPDYASNFTVMAASATSVDEDVEISGTSFSCPTVAGTIASAVLRLRASAGWTGGIAGGELVPPLHVDNRVVRAAVNKTALYPEWEGALLVGGDPAVLPHAPFAEVGWGHVDARIAPDIVDVIARGDLALPPLPHPKAAAEPYMRAAYTARAAFWNDATVAAGERVSEAYDGNAASVPGVFVAVPQDDAGTGGDAPNDGAGVPFTLGVAHAGTLWSTLDASDRYALDAVAGQRIRVALSGASTCMNLLRADGSIVASRCSLAFGTVSMDVAAPESGTFTLRATAITPDRYTFAAALDAAPPAVFPPALPP